MCYISDSVIVEKSPLDSAFYSVSDVSRRRVVGKMNVGYGEGNRRNKFRFPGGKAAGA